MAENLERVRLSEEEEGSIAGGLLLFKSTQTEHYIYSHKDRNTHYGFDMDKMYDIDFKLTSEYDFLDDQVAIQKLIEDGLIWPM